MAKVTEYSRITKMKDNDVLLVDGPDGTRIILQTDASKQMGGEVIMVNETAGDSTKVVINTTDEDIVLATMADLEPVEEDIGVLKESLELGLDSANEGNAKIFSAFHPGYIDNSGNVASQTSGKEIYSDIIPVNGDLLNVYLNFPTDQTTGISLTIARYSNGVYRNRSTYTGTGTLDMEYQCAAGFDGIVVMFRTYDKSFEYNLTRKSKVNQKIDGIETSQIVDEKYNNPNSLITFGNIVAPNAQTYNAYFYNSSGVLRSAPKIGVYGTCIALTNMPDYVGFDYLHWDSMSGVAPIVITRGDDLGDTVDAVISSLSTLKESALTAIYDDTFIVLSKAKIAETYANATHVFINVDMAGYGVRETTYFHNVSLGESQKTLFYKEKIAHPVTGTNRSYIPLGKVDGLYGVINTDSTMWAALQGYDTPAYNGTRVFDKSLASGEIVRLNGSETGVYYRIVFGTPSGTYISNAMASAGYAVKYGPHSIKTERANSDIVTVMHGATPDFPANVLDLYKNAYKKGILCWEADVRPSSDGYVLCHDNDIYNHALTSDGETISANTVLISETATATLKAYKFGIVAGKQSYGLCPDYATDTIPTLEEFLKLAKLYGATPWVEIKFTPSAAQIKAICDIIKKCGMLENTYLVAYQSASTVVEYALSEGIKRLVIVVSDGACTEAAVDTAYGYVGDAMDNLLDVVFEVNYTNYSQSVAEYAMMKGMSIGAYSMGQNVTLATLQSLYTGGCKFFTTNFYNITEALLDTI